MTSTTYLTDLGGISGADQKCAAEFGAGYKALVVGGPRRASLTPFVGDGQQDWVLRKYKRYLNAAGQLIWVTDRSALLGVSGQRRQTLFADLFTQTDGIYPWAGFNDDGTTFPDRVTVGLGTCNGWTTNDSLNGTQFGTFQVETLGNITFGEPCGGGGRLLCVEP